MKNRVLTRTVNAPAATESFVWEYRETAKKHKYFNLLLRHLLIRVRTQLVSRYSKSFTEICLQNQMAFEISCV